MTTKTPNLRFLLSLGNTKMVVLKEADHLHIYSNQSENTARKEAIATERVTEALLAK